MPEKTARWTTMLDGIPNDGSGGTDYLRDQSGAHPTNAMTRGASTAGNRSAVHHSQGVRL
jgi:hypothetical protein